MKYKYAHDYIVRCARGGMVSYQGEMRPTYKELSQRASEGGSGRVPSLNEMLYGCESREDRLEDDYSESSFP